MSIAENGWNLGKFLHIDYIRLNAAKVGQVVSRVAKYETTTDLFENTNTPLRPLDVPLTLITGPGVFFTFTFIYI